MEEPTFPPTKLIETLAGAIASDNNRAMEQLFGEAQIPPAVFRWGFDRSTLSHTPHLELYDRWSSQAHPEALLDPTYCTPAGFSDGTLDYLIVVEPDADYTEVHYHYYGAGIQRAYGHDLTGQTSSGFKTSLATFFIAAYLATVLRGEPLRTSHRPPPDVPVRLWDRLILPPVYTPTPHAGVARFLAANVPVLK